ncbi:MAG: hypothetical protein FK733_15995 [Asgard group archaeon]|nr:hypothetical protein [Asgard group archaeon]
MSEQENYRIGKFPKSRDLIVDAVSMSKYYQHVVGFIDADVTKLLKIFNKYTEKTGEKLSLTAYVMRCMAIVASEIEETRTFRWRKRKTVVFDDVDIKCMIERIVDGKKIPVHYMFRKVDKKSFKEIHNELRYVQQKKMEKSSKDVRQKRRQKRIMSLPKFIRRIGWHFIMTNPFKTNKNLGVVGVTSLSKFSKGYQGLVLPKTMHQTHCLIGAISKKPVVIDDKIVIRDKMSLTLSFNHDVVDGGPSVQFIKRLTDVISDCVDLDEFDI